MSKIQITVGQAKFIAELEERKAPKTCAAFRALLPLIGKIVHVRWCGEAIWMPMGDFQLGVGHENATSHPSKGEILFYPGGISETEILIPYGSCLFSSKVGILAANHFLTVRDGLEALAEVGHDALWSGAKDVAFEEIGV